MQCFNCVLSNCQRLQNLHLPAVKLEGLFSPQKGAGHDASARYCEGWASLLCELLVVLHLCMDDINTMA